jgi:hypothetical protein
MPKLRQRIVNLALYFLLISVTYITWRYIPTKKLIVQTERSRMVMLVSTSQNNFHAMSLRKLCKYERLVDFITQGHILGPVTLCLSDCQIPQQHQSWYLFSKFRIVL